MKGYSHEEHKLYVDGLRRFESRGIPIYIDGTIASDKDWAKIFQVREDGAFYMCDYVGGDEGTLKEIHFDRVYNR